MMGILLRSKQLYPCVAKLRIGALNGLPLKNGFEGYSTLPERTEPLIAVLE